MAVPWTKHRFSGGALALDTANTVVHRGDAARAFDRFDDVGEITRFAAAASTFRAEELGGRLLEASRPDAIAGGVRAMRETIDRLFRRTALCGAMDTGDLQRLVSACAAGLAAHQGDIGLPGLAFGDPATPIAFEAALAISALSLLSARNTGRIRICANCGWLFVDASRNGSRLWCDMAVCGNRRKARRHYQKRRAREREHGHA